MAKKLIMNFDDNRIEEYEMENSLNKWCIENNNKILLDEWDYKKNGNKTPQNVSLGSDEKYWWKCSKCGNEWMADCSHRRSGRGCPKCAKELRILEHHDTILKKNGSLLKKNPSVACEWCYELNGDLKPENVSPSSREYVFWKCKKCGYIWKASITNRSSKSNKTGCPKCSLVYQSSIAEKIVSFYLKKIFSDITENYKPDFLLGREIDIYIPSLNLGIEFDGAPWHKNIGKDLEKDNICFDNGIFLIRIRDVACPELNSSSYVIKCDKVRSNYLSLEKPIRIIVDLINSKFGLYNVLDVDIARDYDEIVGLVVNNVVENSVANSKMVEEWDYEKNVIKPEFISISSNKMVYWKCKKCNGSWKAKPNLRNVGTGCPYCGHRKLLKGYNDLEHIYPEFALEWDYELNGDVKPNMVFAHTPKKFWWKCNKCHNSWKSSPNNRARVHSGCPYCAKSKPKT